jgi:hypothetical protein
MGEISYTTRYWDVETGDDHVVDIRFAEAALDDDECGCLCTFPHNDRGGTLDLERLRSLSYLGAAVACVAQGEIGGDDDTLYLPYALPADVRGLIDNALARLTHVQRDEEGT